MRKRIKCRGGFTMAEIIVVLVILGITLAAAMPTMSGFVKSGDQTKRENTARTLYLAAQSRLTELRITKNLRAEVTGEYYESNGDEKPNSFLMETKNVSMALGELFPLEDAGNEAYVHYISKEKGQTDGVVFDLLAPVLNDIDVLSQAILIEYNIQTGTVLSVFFSEEAEALSYAEDGNESVLGVRGMGKEGYEPIAKQRKQGYYGVLNTGSPDSSINALIDVYDSSQRPLPDSTNENVLYAEIFVPKDSLVTGNQFQLEINGTVVENVELATVSSTYTYDSLPKNTTQDLLIYRYDGDIDETMARFIWVLDSVSGNMADATKGDYVGKHSIGEKYGAVVTLNGEVQVGMSGGALAVSITKAHAYFQTQTLAKYASGNFGALSARHLYNARYLETGTLTQNANIDLGRGFSNFAPIGTIEEPFQGKFIGTNYEINGLTISLSTNHDNIGLFGVVERDLASGVAIQNVTLISPNVSAGDNVGALVGNLSGSVSGIVVVDPKVDGETNVGGVVGENTGNLVNAFVKFSEERNVASITGKNYVGGLVGALQDSASVTNSVLTSAGQFSPVASDLVAGGLVGNVSAGASLKQNIYLAIAPISATSICPITGVYGTGATLEHNYYLSGTGIRPEVEAYNLDTANTGEPLGTFAMYEIADSLGTSWARKHNGTTPLTEEQAIDPTNTVYPYPFLVGTKDTLLNAEEVPLVGGGEKPKSAINSIAYYERYSDYTYGFWFLDDGSDNGTLKNNKTISEVGYCVALTDELYDWTISGNQYFYYLAGSSSATDMATASGVGKATLTFNNDANLRSGFANAYGWAPSAVNVMKLPLASMVTNLKDTIPLRIGFATTSNGSDLRELAGTLHPLFAKGIYQNETIPATRQTAYYIRTAWQFKNIGLLPSTLGCIFTQDMNIDFTHDGLGVHTVETYWVSKTLFTSPIATTFEGVYEGNNKTISNVTFEASSGARISLFDSNKGTVQNLNLYNISAVSVSINFAPLVGLNMDGSLVDNVSVANVTINGDGEKGGITLANRGVISNSTLYNSSISSMGSSPTGGICSDNYNIVRSSAVINADVKNNGSADLGGVAGANRGSISACFVNANTTKEINSQAGKSGGITGNNIGTVSDCWIQGYALSVGNVGNVGGLVGDNNGSLTRSTAQQITVSGGGGNTGGIVGTNTNGATVTDVAFVASTAHDVYPVKSYGNNMPLGGVIGRNNGTLTNAIYVGTAPIFSSGSNTTMYPIVGSGNAATTATNGVSTAFYLAGTNYSLNGGSTWVNKNYNTARTSIVGGGTAIVSQNLNKTWIAQTLGDANAFADWQNPIGNYIYPMITVTPPSAWVVVE